ncbi:hypothetical protein [Flavobacterium sp. GT3P67]|uniref:hypothetical protein n=1 Tax=Flavobacterium sp. GT3P67 TaxID=2541722 RepID=UPI00104DA242|nr:hypothetical protein [Flavobacterium sp. GT3P67]TDE55381.1 hypothetical protein E0H99_03455 [Flavobacterium sp. GT3P67]
MLEEINPKIEFNSNYDLGLMTTPKAHVLIHHLKEIYPRVYKKLNEEGSVEPYLEPKLMKQLHLECDYRLQGYPLTGVVEIALRDVMQLIKCELQPYEEQELLNQFDLDINSIIYTELIK